VASSRGKVSFWNFLPPDELNALLTLFTTVTQKTLPDLEGRSVSRAGSCSPPEDDYEALKDFNHACTRARGLPSKELHLEYPGPAAG
jgi:hypothetical protein